MRSVSVDEIGRIVARARTLNFHVMENDFAVVYTNINCNNTSTRKQCNTCNTGINMQNDTFPKIVFIHKKFKYMRIFQKWHIDFGIGKHFVMLDNFVIINTSSGLKVFVQDRQGQILAKHKLTIPNNHIGYTQSDDEIIVLNSKLTSETFIINRYGDNKKLDDYFVNYGKLIINGHLVLRDNRPTYILYKKDIFTNYGDSYIDKNMRIRWSNAVQMIVSVRLGTDKILGAKPKDTDVIALDIQKKNIYELHPIKHS